MSHDSGSVQLVSTEWSGGGVGRLMSSLRTSLERLGLRIGAVTVSNDARRIVTQWARAATPGVQDATVYSSWFAAIWSQGALLKQVRRSLLLAHGAELYALDGGSAYARLGRRALKSARLVVAVSRYTRDRLVDGGADPGRVVVVTPGVDEALLRRRLQPVPTAAGRSSIASIGRLVTRKNHTLLLEAVARIPEARRPMVEIIGDGPLRAHLEQLCSDLRLTGDVRFHGAADDETTLSLLAQSDAHVMLSRAPADDLWDFEGYGLVHAEAWAVGVPSIGLAGCGAEDAVLNGVTGLLLPREASASTVAVTIDEVLADAADWKARVRSTQPRTWSQFAADLSQYLAIPRVDGGSDITP